MKYIDSERLKAEINKRMGEYDVQQLTSEHPNYEQGAQDALYNLKLQLTSLQQDETQVDKMLCSQVWWEEQGWIMIPPDATIEGIDSLLKQVRKKLQQEQSGVDLDKEIKNERTTLLDAFGSMNGEQSLAIRNFAHYFYELGLKARK